jgi:hypothetical protein
VERGEIVDVSTFKSIHQDFFKGIYVPAGTTTAVSIRFKPSPNPEWGYADRWLEVGLRLDYTGQGGPPGHQGWNRYNEGLRNALEAQSPVKVFEVRPTSPKTYKYWGEMLVTRWYEQFVPEQQRTVIRFVLEVLD